MFSAFALKRWGICNPKSDSILGTFSTVRQWPNKIVVSVQLNPDAEFVCCLFTTEVSAWSLVWSHSSERADDEAFRVKARRTWEVSTPWVSASDRPLAAVRLSAPEFPLTTATIVLPNLQKVWKAGRAACVPLSTVQQYLLLKKIAVIK